MDVLRVFPRRTKATPVDKMAIVGRPPLILPKADEVHVSCTFTWDKPVAEELVRQYKHYYKKVLLGGPAYDDPGGDFKAGMYLKQGYVITTRGCPNKCSFCFVPKREGALRCLPIENGWDVLDNNLLAAPKEHIVSVFEMLKRQTHPIRFTGGIEARRVDSWFVDLLRSIKVECLYLAYDKPSEKKWVESANKLLKTTTLTRRELRCFVLCGYEEDTIEKAFERVSWVRGIGITPFAMYYRTKESKPKIAPAWRKFIKSWTRPQAIWSNENKQTYM